MSCGALLRRFRLCVFAFARLRLTHVEVGDEEAALGQAVELLRLAYNALDMAVTHLSHSSSS
jgi:hypothetical protein